MTREALLRETLRRFVVEGGTIETLIEQVRDLVRECLAADRGTKPVEQAPPLVHVYNWLGHVAWLAQQTDRVDPTAPALYPTQ